MEGSKAEIDNSAPFPSVKEAVMLFGERVLAGQVYANKLKEMQDGPSEGIHGVVTTRELEETKQSLEKSREESMNMAIYLSSLQQELEQTKMELRQLKTRESEKRVLLDLDIEDLKFVENSTERVKRETLSSRDNQRVEFHKKKYVRFANPPSVSHHIIFPPPPAPPSPEVVLERHPSLKRKKKKPLISLIGGIFSKLKRSGSSDVSYMA